MIEGFCKKSRFLILIANSCGFESAFYDDRVIFLVFMKRQIEFNEVVCIKLKHFSIVIIIVNQC
jgi:hypothetical protein